MSIYEYKLRKNLGLGKQGTVTLKTKFGPRNFMSLSPIN